MSPWHQPSANYERGGGAGGGGEGGGGGGERGGGQSVTLFLS